MRVSIYVIMLAMMLSVAVYALEYMETIKYSESQVVMGDVLKSDECVVDADCHGVETCIKEKGGPKHCSTPSFK